MKKTRKKLPIIIICAFAVAAIFLIEINIAAMQAHVVHAATFDSHFYLENLNADIPPEFFTSIPGVEIVYAQNLLTFRVTEPIAPQNYDAYFKSIVNATSMMLMDLKPDVVFGIPRDWHDFASTQLYQHVLSFFPGAQAQRYPLMADDEWFNFGGTPRDVYAPFDEAFASLRMAGYSVALLPAAVFGAFKIKDIYKHRQ